MRCESRERESAIMTRQANVVMAPRSNKFGPRRGNVPAMYPFSCGGRLLTTQLKAEMVCQNCGQNNHITEDCRHLGKPRCTICGKFGHAENTCWEKTKKCRDPFPRTGPPATKKGKACKEQTHQVKKQNEVMELSEDEQIYAINGYNVND